MNYLGEYTGNFTLKYNYYSGLLNWSNKGTVMWEKKDFFNSL